LSFPHTARIQYPNLTAIRNSLSLFFSLDQNPLLRCKIHHFNLLNPLISHQSKPITISRTSLSSFFIVKTLQQTPSSLFVQGKNWLLTPITTSLHIIDPQLDHDLIPTKSTQKSTQFKHEITTSKFEKKKLPKNLNHHHNPKNQVFLCFFIG